MLWKRIEIANTSLLHLTQDENSNQCVIASLAMIQKNLHLFITRSNSKLFILGHASMLSICSDCDFPDEGLDSLSFISKYGMRPDAIPHYLRRCGYSSVNIFKSDIHGNKFVSDAINKMKNGDAAILACGVGQLHAVAAFKKKNCTFVMNPMPADNEYRVCCYKDNKNATKVFQDGVFFESPCLGVELFRNINICYKLPYGSFRIFKKKKYIT